MKSTDPLFKETGSHALTLERCAMRSQVASLPTPQNHDAQGPKTDEQLQKMKANGHGVANLNETAMLSSVHTPNLDDCNNTTRKSGEFGSLTRDVNLATVVSPSSLDWKDSAGMAETRTNPDGSTRNRLDLLPRQALLAASGETATGGTAATANTGQLNAAYARWLQGLPPEWDQAAIRASRKWKTRRRPE